jgi:ABC-2 type transport system permease protein
MRKLVALVSARNKEFYRDRAALIWTLLFPFIVLAGFTYGYSGRQEPLLKVSVFPPAAMIQPVIRMLQETPGVEMKPAEFEGAVLKKLEHYETDLVISSTEGGRRLIYSLNQDSDKGRLSERVFLAAVDRQPLPRPGVEAKVVSGKRLRYSDWLLPGLLAMNIMFGSMFGVGYVIVRYRKNGVLKRLRATPLSAFQFLSAQVISRMFLMVVTSLMVLAGAMILIGFRPVGSWMDFTVFLCVSSAAMISLGLVVAARISTEEVAEGVLNLMTWPMIFLSGIWFSIDGATQWVVWAVKAMPLTHIVDGLRSILIDGASLTQVLPQISLLLGLSVIFLGIGSAIFRWR